MTASASPGRCAARCLSYVFMLAAIAVAAAVVAIFIVVLAISAVSRDATARELSRTVLFATAYVALTIPPIVILTYALTQPLQGAALALLARPNSDARLAALALSVIILGVLSFECFDHLGPASILFMLDDDLAWTPGLTPNRAAIFILLQALIASFDAWRLRHSGLLDISR